MTDRKNDPNLSGKFLITKIRHDFVEDKETKHTMLMTVIKDSTINQYPNASVSYENKSKPEEITLYRKEKQLNFVMIQLLIL